MVTLDQVRALEARIDKALAAIDRLTSENSVLRATVARETARAADLEKTIEEYRRDQARIEQGILHALERLNAFEDAILDPGPAAVPRPSAEKPVHAAAQSAAPQSAPGAPAAPKTAAPQAASRPEPSSSGKEAADPAPGAEGAELEIF